ncbi:MAG: hypothetical protein QNM02_03440 [Acidimicrobiia bacterium]|nr:hypothetical protein [Acidimicrobiia bacterium]
MCESCTNHQLPRAGVDPLDDDATALALLSAVIASPPRSETIAILLDSARRGHSIVVVSGTERPDDLLRVVDVLAGALPAQGPATPAGVILASVRPGGRLDERDGDRWFETSDSLAAHGVELVEWFVVADDVNCPRDLLGVPPRWSSWWSRR